jgi:hypothetical protein
MGNSKISPLSRTLQVEGWSLDVVIRKDRRQWHLEVVDERGSANVWLESFRTEQEALDEALRAIREEGAAGFSIGLPYRDH